MPKKAKANKAEERRVEYPFVYTEIYKRGDHASYMGAMTLDVIDDLLGWCEDIEEANEAGFSDPTLYVGEGKARKPVWLLNNKGNRPFTYSWAESIGQDILNFNWHFNGETIVIGRQGMTLSAQHRLAGAKLAEIERTGPRSDHWKRKGWSGPVEIETTVIYGIDETPEVMRTLDNTRPRTPADHLYGSGLFPKLGAQAEKKLVKVLENAVRFIWSRTGMGSDAFSSKKGTISELMDFHDRHKRLVQMVWHLHVEDAKRGGIKNLRVGMGQACGLAYLMAAGKSDRDKYEATKPPSEKKLNFSLMDKAKEFWKAVASGAEETKAVRDAISNLVGMNGEVSGSMKEKLTVLCRAWNLYRDGEELTEDSVSLTDDDYVKYDDRWILVTKETVGGIDLGDPTVREPKQKEKPPVIESIDDTDTTIGDGEDEEAPDVLSETDDEARGEDGAEAEEETKEQTKARKTKEKREKDSARKKEKRRAARRAKENGNGQDDEEEAVPVTFGRADYPDEDEED